MGKRVTFRDRTPGKDVPGPAPRLFTTKWVRMWAWQYPNRWYSHLPELAPLRRSVLWNFALKSKSGRVLRPRQYPEYKSNDRPI